MRYIAGSGPPTGLRLVAVEDRAPAFVHAHVHRGELGETFRAVAVEVAMLELDSGFVAIGKESNFNLGFERGIVGEVRAELPGEHDPVRRVPDQDLAPLFLGAVLRNLKPSSADARFDHDV